MTENKMIDEQELENVSGGVTDAPAPTPTGGVSYKCPVCGTSIAASTRDMTVTCPNLKCRRQFQIKNGKLIAV